MFNYRAVNRTGDQPYFPLSFPRISIPSRLLCALLLLRLSQLDTS
jgi:hypothetical protein